MSKAPTTLLEAVTHFVSYENCHEFMMNLRWPDGKVHCPRCGSDDVSYLPNARVFKCYQKHERQKFSLKVGTIFEDSPIGLEKWLPVMWMLVNSKNGISSWEIHRAIGVTQKTAWFMLQRARLAMQDENHGGGKIGGEVEVDETYIGGKARNMHKDRKARVLQGAGNARPSCHQHCHAKTDEDNNQNRLHSYDSLRGVLGLGFGPLRVGFAADALRSVSMRR